MDPRDGQVPSTSNNNNRVSTPKQSRTLRNIMDVQKDMEKLQEEMKLMKQREERKEQLKSKQPVYSESNSAEASDQFADIEDGEITFQTSCQRWCNGFISTNV